MGGDQDDKGPYRTSVDPPPPSSDPVRSSRVLSALAQLRSVKGDVEESAALSERAARARVTEGGRPVPIDSRRKLGRCIRGNSALVVCQLDRARQAYRKWLDAAYHRPTREEFRMEVYAALAATRVGPERDDALREAIRSAQRAGDASLPKDAPTAAALLLSRTFRCLGRSDLASRLLACVTSPHAYPLAAGSLDLERAHAAFSIGNTDETAVFLRAAATARSSSYGEKHVWFAECAILGGRVLHRLGHYAEAEKMLAEARDILTYPNQDFVMRAAAMGAFAALFWNLDRQADALVAANSVRELLHPLTPSAEQVPALTSALSVYANAGRHEHARVIERRIAAIHAQYSP